MTRLLIIVWDGVTRFARLPGGWLLPLGVAVLFLGGVFLLAHEAINGVVLVWRERQERHADQVNAAYRSVQDERRIRLVSRTGSR